MYQILRRCAMRKGLFGIGLVVLFLVMTGLASAGQFGPTEPTANPGKFSFGVGYFWEDTKFDMDFLSLDANFRTQSNQVYLQGSYAPVKEFEIFGRLGGADLKTKNSDLDFGDGAKFFGTLGLKAIFWQNNNFGVGAFGQGTYRFQDYKDSLSVNFTDENGVPSFVNLDMKLKNYYDIQGGISAQFKCKDFIVYGGGFYYYAHAKVDFDVTVPGAFGSDTETADAKTPVGGFLGVKIPFTKQMGLTLEGQYRDEFSGGAFLSYSF